MPERKISVRCRNIAEGQRASPGIQGKQKRSSFFSGHFSQNKTPAFASLTLKNQALGFSEEHIWKQKDIWSGRGAGKKGFMAASKKSFLRKIFASQREISDGFADFREFLEFPLCI